MSATSGNSISGACLCGAVRFTAAPKNREVGACHCSMCRRWSAGPFITIDCENTLKIDNTENLGVYRSSEWAERGFCKKCGSPLFYRLVGKDLYFASAEALDDRKDYVFAAQIFIDEKPEYYAFANHTQNMTGAEVFAAFAEDVGGQTKA